MALATGSTVALYGDDRAESGGMNMARQLLWRAGKRILLLVGGILVVGGGVFFFLRPTPVTVSEVVVREIAPTVHGVGTVEAKVVVQIGAKIAGRIVSIFADQGDTGKAGHLLAQLE